MVFISPSEKHHDLPGSAIHIKLNHIHWLWPMTDSFTSFHRPYRETTAPINLTSKNVQKYTPQHPPPPPLLPSKHHHQHTPTHSPALLQSSHIQNHTKTNTFQNLKPIKPNKTNKAGQVFWVGYERKREMALQWKPVKGGPFAKLSFMRYGSHACTSLLPALHTCCHCDTLAERSLCSPGDQFKPWQHHTKPGCHLFRGTPRNPSPHLSGGLRGTLCPCVCVNVSGWERGSERGG